MAMVCDCDVEDRATRVLKRTRIPRRYEHCDFESFVTDLADGKTYTPQNVLSLKQAKLVAQGFAQD